MEMEDPLGHSAVGLKTLSKLINKLTALFSA